MLICWSPPMNLWHCIKCCAANGRRYGQIISAHSLGASLRGRRFKALLLVPQIELGPALQLGAFIQARSSQCDAGEYSDRLIRKTNWVEIIEETLVIQIKGENIHQRFSSAFLYLFAIVKCIRSCRRYDEHESVKSNYVLGMLHGADSIDINWLY